MTESISELARDLPSMIECEASTLAEHANVRAAFGLWNDVLHELRSAAHALRSLGETREADALLADSHSIARRARQHLQRMARKSEQPNAHEVGGGP